MCEKGCPSGVLPSLPNGGVKLYADFKGRAPRAEYWWFYLLTIVAGIPARLLDKGLDTKGALDTLVSIAFLLPWLAVTVRRLHDLNRGGWWLLVFMVGFVAAALFAVAVSDSVSATAAFGPIGLIVFALVMIALVVAYLFFMMAPGTEGSNDYGPDPYGPDELEEVFA
jgi:uncharacterized membrane protein YhaH (DUF805 family)